MRALAARAGIEVVADVPDAVPWYAGSDVVVVPLRIGTGTRVKALEAMACGRPVVGTTVGLEGLRLDGIAGPAPARIADDGPGLAAAVVDLLRDPEAARRHGAAGRRHVEAHFSWAPIAADHGRGAQRGAPPRGGRPMTDVAVLVCTRGRPHLLEDCLRSVLGSTPSDGEVVLVESGASRSPLRDVGDDPRLRHLLVHRPGKSRQLNEGIRAMTQGVVVITDDDCRVDPAWVDAMRDPFDDPEVGAVFGPVDGLSGVRGAAVQRPRPGPAPLVTWDYANGAAMAVRRAAVVAVGGFDERLGPGAPVHGEEHDLVLRLQEAGWTVRVAAAPIVEHLEWRDLAETRRQPPRVLEGCRGLPRSGPPARRHGSGRAPCCAGAATRPRCGGTVRPRACGSVRPRRSRSCAASSVGCSSRRAASSEAAPSHYSRRTLALIERDFGAQLGHHRCGAHVSAG